MASNRTRRTLGQGPSGAYAMNKAGEAALMTLLWASLGILGWYALLASC